MTSLSCPKIGLRSTLAVAALIVLLAAVAAQAQQEPSYVGSARCGECHDEQYEFYTKNSKKARSWHSVERMQRKLTPAELESCYDCHTTGHGRSGGFVSHETTPQLADVGCETCHGPGGRHAESGDPADIKRTPTLEDCQRCHNSDRIQDFKFKPLRFSGAH